MGDFEGFLAKSSEYTQDEFGTNYMAAKNCPKLSSEDRRYLVLDAMERAKTAGVSINVNSFMRRTIYGRDYS
ncbi:MAG: hypothetical protein LIO65_09120 [Odoribacter sp.]|nr:hypothetical protein [Odoribacter sp.]